MVCGHLDLVHKAVVFIHWLIWMQL